MYVLKSHTAKLVVSFSNSLQVLVGGMTKKYYRISTDMFRWTFWIQLIWGGAAQVIHFFTVPETRCSILLDKEAKRRRKEGRTSYYGPNEVITNRITVKSVCDIWIRPFRMMVTEPIVLFCSLLSGFSSFKFVPSDPREEHSPR